MRMLAHWGFVRVGVAILELPVGVRQSRREITYDAWDERVSTKEMF